MTLAQAAIAEDRLDDLRALLETHPELAGERTDEGISLVLSTRYQLKLEAVQVLLQAGPELDVFDAAALGPLSTLSDLCDEDPERSNAAAADGHRPLHLAAYFGNEEGVALLLERGVPVGTTSLDDSQRQVVERFAAHRGRRH